ncbi:hypothetical protein BSKO_10786 [Bryopsis sp. KO-2023]|nr:hypothetical protein BSKO_10786 [Bryopsis sp. KO-2023]
MASISPKEPMQASQLETSPRYGDSLLNRKAIEPTFAQTEYISELRSGLTSSQLFAHAASETQAAIEPRAGQRYRSKKRQANSGPGHIEVFPRINNRPPRLLEHLSSLLAQKKREGERLAAAGGPGQRDPKVAQNLTLDAHRQVLNDFIESFPTYRHLLTDVKKHMDACLDDGVRCARDNVILREQLAKAEESAEAEVETAKLETSLDAAEIRKKLHPKLSEATVLANKAEFRKKAAIQDLKQARRELLEEREMLNEAREMREKLSALLEAESQWHENGLAEELSRIEVGSITKKEEQELDGEVAFESIVAEEPSTPGEPVADDQPPQEKVPDAPEA